ncbi:eukaryotic translation initiation factor 4 gamma 1 isoform X1 [Heteronotia binoei]|uniref:eukaryotic translation initiation factor 4 gamma 1 isoform X1 n=1 Tax=Heteronotia binoei TaxID=13085 RepID=UPI00292F7799|nr:eukaryotic translation initiation factor 4 gamma 1 isoform X1 [Heteronotia binoei]XP_060098580.1 eukaryotic translation initiation factor 4 gamma 1 isoform X1 [Heteronotia binoei]XP_060098581.1 eukaryotic translation initiation factor 4 gamma 1 isoform X1 [Heteronotia binoei]
MNKTPQPSGGTPSAPHPSPSPGLPQQSAFPPGQPASVVFNPAQATQMNTPSQPRQFAAGPRAIHQQGGFRSLQHFYQSRAQPPTSASRVQSNASARPGPPAHVYPAASQVMMIPSQISYPASQGAYYIPGQSRSTYVVPTQQYPVQPGAPSFYPGASPTEFSTYAGAYYPTQGVQQFPAAQVMLNQQPPIPPKRERKTIRIRDPNQGGKDITEEIMSGARTSSTPTPPQAGSGPEPQANGETHVAVIVRPDDRPKTGPVISKPISSEANKSASPSPPPPLIAEADTSLPADMSMMHPESPLEADTTAEPPEVTADILEPVSATTTVPGGPVVPPEVPEFDPEPQEEPAAKPGPELPPQMVLEDDEEAVLAEIVTPQPEAPQPEEPPATPPDSPPTPPPSLEEASEGPLEANGMPEEEPTEPEAEPHLCQPDPAAESPIVQPEELQIPNGLGIPGKQEGEEPKEEPESDVSPISEPEEVKEEELAAPQVTPPPEEEGEPEPEEAEGEEPAETQEQSAEPAAAPSETEEMTVQVAVSVPKKKRKLKDLNKKDNLGDLLDAFKEADEGSSEAENNPPVPAPEPEEPAPVRSQEEADETWEEKEDKLDPEKVKAADQKYRYKEEQWKPLNPEEKKRYDREFLLGFQFIFASMQKPEGLPHISDVVLEKANKTPLRPPDIARLSNMNCGPDFTPSFANLGRPAPPNRGPPVGPGQRRSQQNLRVKEPRKIIATVSLNEDVKLNKAEKAWKPSSKRATEAEDPENIKTQELFRRVRSILNKLTPQMFQQLMKQVTDLSIDTEERLKGVIDLIFEKAISEPNFSVAYANMCRCLMGLKVPTTDKPTVMVNFRKVLLNRCQKEFEKDKDDDEIFEKKQKEMDDTAGPEERARLKEELDDARDKARRRSLGNIKFIGELFKLKMLTEAIMHDCVVKLLKNHDEESLECLCRLLTTIGKDLDFEKAKPRMDQYFNQMEKIIKEKKTSSRIRFMLQDVIDLRRNSWVPRRGDQGPKTIDQIHKEAEMEEHREHIKVQQLMSKQDKRRGPPGPSSAGGRGSLVSDDGWNTVPISKGNRPIDTTRLSKITKPGSIDSNNQLFAPGGRLSWGKGSSGGSGAKPAEPTSDSNRPATSTLNRFSALQPTSTESQDARRVVQRSSTSRDRSEKGGDRGDRLERERPERGERLERSERPDRSDRNRAPVTKRSFSKEMDDRSREHERERQGVLETIRKVSSMTEERDRSREPVKREPVAPGVPPKPALSEEELEKKAKAIIEEYLHINDMKEALQCVQELGCPSQLYIFVRNGIESTLERSTIAREHMGLLLYQLVKGGSLAKEQYYKGLQEILEIGEDMEIDIPHIWLYLAEIITPILREGGISMEELFREIAKPLVPIGKATTLLLEILGLLCKGMSHKKAGTLWREGGLSWKEFLPEDQDVNKFITEQKVEYTMGDSSDAPSRKELTSEDLCKQLDKLLKENADNQRIFDWIEANLSEQQFSSNVFVRALMTSVCHSAVVFENPYRMDSSVIKSRTKLLQKYVSDEHKELQALYALQALVVKLDQPANLLRVFFDTLYDEDVIKEEAFYKWESSKDPAEQQGKGVALKSVTAFYTWLREAEDESDNN